eukprot:gi/632965984/ref/XP_007899162.1/ PREDICTED: otoconin-90 [Callorhinchus milii]
MLNEQFCKALKYEVAEKHLKDVEFVLMIDFQTGSVKALTSVGDKDFEQRLIIKGNILSLSSSDCLGTHFTWLQSVFDSFPAFYSFVNKLKCVTGYCPKDFENYGCVCRFREEGLPADETDSCCFQHRTCYQEVADAGCRLDPGKVISNNQCSTKNLTCAAAMDACEQRFCKCDNSVIQCLLKANYNSSLKCLDTTICKPFPTDLEAPEQSTVNGVTGPQVPGAAAGIPVEVIAEDDIHGDTHCAAIKIFRICFSTDCDRRTFLRLKENGRLKHELPQMGELLLCLTGRCPYDFEQYGCFCGQEGRGRPIDELDRCCFYHHCCLDEARKLGCRAGQSLTGQVYCMDQQATCTGLTLCDQFLCSCDKAAAECISASVYNSTLQGLNKEQCRGEQASCKIELQRALPDSFRSHGGPRSEESAEERVGGTGLRGPGRGRPLERRRGGGPFSETPAPPSSQLSDEDGPAPARPFRGGLRGRGTPRDGRRRNLVPPSRLPPSFFQ